MSISKCFAFDNCQIKNLVHTIFTQSNEKNNKVSDKKQRVTAYFQTFH